MTSPLFSESFSKCKISYYCFINGSLHDGYLELSLHDSSIGKDIPLERVNNLQSTDFNKRLIQIGKRVNPFNVIDFLLLFDD